MEEKERYKVYKDNREHSYICDTSKNVDYKIYQEFVDLLNQQDARIKELENMVIDKQNKLYSRLDEIKKLQEENQQLKQAQKQLAIEELEKLKQVFKIKATIDINKGIIEVINEQIENIKGE